MSSLNNGRLWPVAGDIGAWAVDTTFVLLALLPCCMELFTTLSPGDRSDQGPARGSRSARTGLVPFLMLESTGGRSLALRHTDTALGACHLCPPLLLVNLGRHRRDVTTDLHPHAYISVSPR